MSRIRADAIVNRDANGPVIAAEGITIPLNKRISVGGSIGTEGQYLGVTSTGLAWSTPAGGSGGSYSYTDLTNKPLLFSGSYTDLTNKPIIPAGQVQSNWTSTSGLGQILNKPSLFSGSYTDLTDKPTIPGAYSLPTASSSSLGGVIVGTGLSIDLNGVVSATSGITDIVLDLTPQLGGNLDLNSKNITGTGNIDVTGDVTGKGLKLSYNNPTSLSTPGTSGEIRKIDGSPFWYDGVEWREFFLINATAVTQVADTDWDRTILRCDFEIDANDLRFGEIATIQGTAAISSAQYKFGTKSLRIDSSISSGIVFQGSSNRPEYNFEGEWTIEGWYYFNATQNYPGQNQNNGFSTLFSVSNRVNSANIIYVRFQCTNTALGSTFYQAQRIIYSSGTTGSTEVSWYASAGTANEILPNTWCHIAVQRSSTGLISIIVNGNRQGSYIENGIVNIANENINIGQAFYESTNYPGGFIDDFRISTIARYSSTSNSTPPTTALPITGSTTTIIPTNSSNTFGISAETATGTNAKLRLSKSNSTQDDILLVGAGGLTIARTDDSTITFTGGSGSGVAQVNSDWTATSGLAQILNKPTLFSGSYTDLTNKPTIPAAQINSNWTATSGLAQILNKPTLFSGSYTDLTDKPTIPSAQVNSDWNAVSGITQILNKPSIPGAYSLPTASSSSLGGIKIGTGLSIDGSGIVSASAVSNLVNDYISEWTLTALNNDHYRFSGPGFIGPENDPVLYLVRGQKYKFTNLMGMHPFQIQSTPGISGTAYEEGILNNRVINGTLTWDVQFDSPSILYYQCTAHTNMGGSIRVLDEVGFTGPIDSLSDVVITSPSNGQVLTYSGTTWSNSPSTIQNVYSSVSNFPAANLNKGAFAYDDSNGIMYYSNAVSWTSQRIVTTNSSTSSDFATLLGNNQLTYSTSVVDVTSGNTAFNLARKILRLSNSAGTTSDVTVVAGAGLSIARTDNNLTITNDLAFTYGISAETATGANTTLRLGRTDSTNDDILLVGADGLLIERTDASTITFRAPPTVVTQYTDALAKDAVYLALNNGTKVGIEYTYDSVNKVINSLVSGGGGGGEVLTYDLQGRSTTSNNAFVDLIPSTGTTDSIEFASSGGSSVAWDNANKRITISSVAPVSADWNASSGLTQILNKPTIPSDYTLPTASVSVIGGIKVGANLSINATTGVLDANTGSYTLPTATGSVLGGIKIGSGLSIDGNGVVTASGSSSVPIIQELSGTTASLATDATAELNIVGYKAYSLFKIVSNAESWIRVYTDDVSRDADATRSEGQDPISGSGVIAEIRTDGVTNTVLISPGILGFNNDSPRTTSIYLSVTNRSVTPTAITVTLTALKIGE